MFRVGVSAVIGAAFYASGANERAGWVLASIGARALRLVAWATRVLAKTSICWLEGVACVIIAELAMTMLRGDHDDGDDGHTRPEL